MGHDLEAQGSRLKAQSSERTAQSAQLDVATILSATTARVLQVSSDGQLVPGALSPADLAMAVTEVCIDSRSVTPGALFIALRGERADGHDYVGPALQGGALACLVARLPDPVTSPQAQVPPPQAWVTLSEPLQSESGPRAPSGCRRQGPFLFHVPDTLLALHRLAHHWRRRHNPEVIGITGSIGKTTAREIVASVLAFKWPVLKTEANYNTEIGLPLTVLRLAPQHRAAVLEMGMYAPGDVALLARMAEPRIGVVTNVAPIHLERMQTLERIARAKSELIAALPPTGLAILNGDDPWTRAMAQTSGVAPVLLIGSSPNCDYRALEVTVHGLEGLSFSLSAEGRRIPFRTRVPGTHTVQAFLSGVAVGRAMGMEWNELQEAVEQVELDARQRILRGPEGMLIIDDSYNAAPLSMNAALDLLRAAPGTKIAVLGDMLELGQGEEDAHRQIGERAAEVADWLIVRGQRSSWIAEGAAQRGLPADRSLQAGSNADAVETVRAIVTRKRVPGGTKAGATAGAPSGSRTMTSAKPGMGEPVAPRFIVGDIQWSVLVKGSRGMRMEEVVQGLRGDV